MWSQGVTGSVLNGSLSSSNLFIGRHIDDHQIQDVLLGVSVEPFDFPFVQGSYGIGGKGKDRK